LQKKNGGGKPVKGGGGVGGKESKTAVGTEISLRERGGGDGVKRSLAAVYAKNLGRAK